MTVLCVDDRVERLSTLQARLQLLGYRVETALDGTHSLEIFRTTSIDLAIVDYYMTGMNGDLFALEMKHLKPAVPIIIFSGAFTLPEMVIAIVDGFISTCDDTDCLLAKVSELLNKRRWKQAS